MIIHAQTAFSLETNIIFAQYTRPETVLSRAPMLLKPWKNVAFVCNKIHNWIHEFDTSIENWINEFIAYFRIYYIYAVRKRAKQIAREIETNRREDARFSSEAIVNSEFLSPRNPPRLSLMRLHNSRHFRNWTCATAYLIYVDYPNRMQNERDRRWNDLENCANSESSGAQWRT